MRKVIYDAMKSPTVTLEPLSDIVRDGLRALRVFDADIADIVLEALMRQGWRTTA